MKKKVVIYCRVSSDEQKKHDTIEGQIDTLKTYLDLNKDKYEFVGEYLDNGVSGTVPFNFREGGKRLLKDAKEKHYFDTILVYRVDRFGRDTRTGLNAIEEIVNTGAEIQSLSEPFDLNTPTGRFQFIMYLNMAELERNNILDRMFIGATRAAKQGRWLGGIVPYGYYLDKENYLHINEYEANIVRYIFYLYTEEKKTYLDIAVYLNSLCISKNMFAEGKGKKKNDVIWNNTAIGRIITNTTYIGLHKYGKNASRRKEIIERKVPAIIPQYVFDKAQEIKDNNKIIKDTKVSKRPFILRGLIKCSKCGKNYQGVTYQRKNDVYVCASKRYVNRRLRGTKCTNLNVNADMIEEYVWGLCKKVMINFRDFTIDKIEDNNSVEINKLKNKLDGFEDEKNKIMKLFRKDLIDESELEMQLKDINKEKESVEKLLNKLTDKERLKKETNETIDKYKNKFKFYIERINKLTDVQKAEIIRMLVKSIEVNTTIDGGKQYPALKIIWNLVNVSPPTPRHKYKYVDINNLEIKNNSDRGNRLAALRLDAGIKKTELSKELNIAINTLTGVEKGTCNALYYYSLYCKYFNKEPYSFLRYDLLKEDTYKDIVKKVMATYCCISAGDLSEKLGLYRCAIDNSTHGGSDKVKEIIFKELYKIKKKYM